MSPRRRKRKKRMSPKKKAALIAALGVLLILLALLLMLLLFSKGGAGGTGGGSSRFSGKGPGQASGRGGGGKGGTGPGSTSTGKEKQKKGPDVVMMETNLDIPKPSHIPPPTAQFPNSGGRQGGGGGGTSFFGIRAQGASFVYIVDCSGSMSGAALIEAKSKLRTSISWLNEKQKFFVFFYDSASYPMPGGKMLNATEENKRFCYKWIEQIAGGGGTKPRESLRAAIMMRPEVIFFMSDGMFSPMVCDMVRQAQGSHPVTIHTVGFIHRGGEPVLKRLAAENGGTYKFVHGVSSAPPRTRRVIPGNSMPRTP